MSSERSTLPGCREDEEDKLHMQLDVVMEEGVLCMIVEWDVR